MNTIQRLACVASLLPIAVGQTIVAGSGLPWTGLEPGYVVEVFVTDLQLPVNIAFVPNPGSAADDPFFYVTELRGTIKVVNRLGEANDYATGLLDYSPPESFPGPGEQGLTGIAVDPATGNVYVSMLYDSTQDPGTHYPKVVRLTSSDGGRTADTLTTILDMTGEPQGQAHQVSDVSIGPDGLLYVHNGDGFDSAVAQDLDSFRGKILRLNLDGSAPSDNPFYDAGGGDKPSDYVFAYGLRNPFGGDWRAADGLLYEVENGPSIDRFAQVVAGRNYLWDGSNQSMTEHALYTWNPATGPVNLAFVQRESFGGSGFPVEKMGHAFVTEAGHTYASGPQIDGKRITEWVLDATGTLVSGPADLIEYNGTGKNTTVALAAGPDGLYFSDFYRDVGADSPIDRGANILRIRWLSVPRLKLTVERDELSWESLAGVSVYDVIRGELGALLASGGDFAQAGVVCRIDDTSSNVLTETGAAPPGQAYWFLVRDMNDAGNGSYESGGIGQRGLRDAEIKAAPSACP